ncbi:hypothetical protein [Ferrimonas marina]|uniref:Uncharacterized protein n=1 Tax=Ferrimonas marina TaxID=299255 RepID=A0A1M5TTI3_9GAMM|nr:hypothetical protein [Ferrimonas marina]SHH53713.1 hypothetical protein SAMN02745129_2262 [Ferrimonas marina]
MNRYPTRVEAKHLTRHLRDHLSLTLCQAQRKLAWMYGCPSWTLLKQCFGKPAPDDHAAFPGLYHLDSPRQRLERCIEPQRSELQLALKRWHPSPIGPDSMVAQILAGNTLLISDEEILELFDGGYGDIEQVSGTEVVQCLLRMPLHLDHMLAQPHRFPMRRGLVPSSRRRDGTGGWLRFPALDQRVYVGCVFEGRRVGVQIKEWDTYSRSVHPDDGRLQPYRDLAEGWGVIAMLGFLRHLIRQSQLIGYEPVLYIGKIRDLRVSQIEMSGPRWVQTPILTPHANSYMDSEYPESVAKFSRRLKASTDEAIRRGGLASVGEAKYEAGEALRQLEYRQICWGYRATDRGSVDCVGISGLHKLVEVLVDAGAVRVADFAGGVAGIGRDLEAEEAMPIGGGLRITPADVDAALAGGQ